MNGHRGAGDRGVGMRKLLFAAAFGAGVNLSACATMPPNPDAPATNDPYEATNREIFALNLKIDGWTLRPTATAYANNVPEGLREAVHNVLANLDLPITFTNDVLQAEPRRAGQTVSRFLVNSTLGVGGLFDMASRVGIPDHTEDFGQTLAVWGAGEGPYFVLPLLGPNPPRDLLGQGVDFAFDPTIYVRIKQHPWWMMGHAYVTILDLRARNMETLDDIERTSLDFYATTRSLYRQHRASEIRNGEADVSPTDTPPP